MDKNQIDILREQLKQLGWSIPVAWAGNQVVWRHIKGNIKIFYTSKMCVAYDIQAEQKGVLTPAIKKCYEEVAEAFAHIARFFNAEK